MGPLDFSAPPAAALKQDGTRYLDCHHTENDRLYKIDPAGIAQKDPA